MSFRRTSDRGRESAGEIRQQALSLYSAGSCGLDSPGCRYLFSLRGEQAAFYASRNSKLSTQNSKLERLAHLHVRRRQERLQLRRDPPFARQRRQPQVDLEGKTG